MYVDSSNFSTGNRDAIMRRLMENPEDFAQILRMYYSEQDSNAVKVLQSEQISKLEEMTDAANRMEHEKMMVLAEQMQKNAGEIADLLAQGNPEYDKEYLEQMLKKLANSTYEDVNLMMEQKYPQALMVYEDSARNRMELADYLTDGMIRNFYDKKM